MNRTKIVKIIIMILACAIISKTSLCPASEIAQRDEDELNEEQFDALTTEMQLVFQEFMTLMLAGKIPGPNKTNKSEWKFDVFKINKKYLSVAKDIKFFRKEINECRELFKVDAQKDPPAKKMIRCLFCKRDEKIELLSIYDYSFEDDKWIKIEEEKKKVLLNEKSDDTPQRPK